LSQLGSPGARTLLLKDAVNINDLAALTAKTGDEFVMFTTGGRRLVIRGTDAGFHGIIDPAWAEGMAQKGWRFSGHTHPIYEGETSAMALRSSEGDRAIPSIFGQQRSVIINSAGDWRLFGPSGDLLTGWKP